MKLMMLLLLHKATVWPQKYYGFVCFPSKSESEFAMVIVFFGFVKKIWIWKRIK